MASSLAPDIAVAIRRAAERATLAPSIHNTQPWQFVLGLNQLDLRDDPARRLAVVDPANRQSAISCGAALFGARVALAADGLEVATQLLPDTGDPDLLATITVIGPSAEAAQNAARLDAAADSRHSNRRKFTSDEVPDAVIDVLRDAAAVEGAWLQPVLSLDDRVAVATYSQHADAMQNADRAYRAELRDWTTADPERLDGVPISAIPQATGAAHDDVPIRDFDTSSSGQLPEETRSSLQQTMLVLGTAGDGQREWLVAGQALARVLLELTSVGFVATIFSQFAEVPGTRQGLRQDLRLGGEPHLLLRVGRAESTPPTPRRQLDQVITEG
jgi:nitroreductase